MGELGNTPVTSYFNIFCWKTMEDPEVTQTTTDLTLIPSAPEAVLQCCPYGLTTCFQLPLRQTTSHSERRCSVAVLRGSSGDGTSVRRCGYGPLLAVTGLHKATNHKAIRLSEHGGENCKVERLHQFPSAVFGRLHLLGRLWKEAQSRVVVCNRRTTCRSIVYRATKL